MNFWRVLYLRMDVFHGPLFKLTKAKTDTDRVSAGPFFSYLILCYHISFYQYISHDLKKENIEYCLQIQNVLRQIMSMVFAALIDNFVFIPVDAWTNVPQKSIYSPTVAYLTKVCLFSNAASTAIFSWYCDVMIAIVGCSDLSTRGICRTTVTFSSF